MFLNIRSLILISCSLYLVHGSSTNPHKRKTPPPPATTGNAKYAKFLKNPLFRDTSREHLVSSPSLRKNESPKGDSSSPPSGKQSTTVTTSSPHGTTSASSSVQQQIIPTRNQVPTLTSAKTRRLILLQGTTNAPAVDRTRMRPPSTSPSLVQPKRRVPSLASPRISGSNLLRDETNIVGDVMPAGDRAVIRPPSRSQPANRVSTPKSSMVNDSTLLRVETDVTDVVMSVVDSTITRPPSTSQSRIQPTSRIPTLTSPKTRCPTLLQDKTDVVMSVADHTIVQQPSTSQQLIQPKSRISIHKSSRINSSAPLRDTSNVMEVVQPEVGHIVVPQSLQVQPTIQMQDTTTTPTRVIMGGGRFSLYHNLPCISPGMELEDLSVLDFTNKFGEHSIDFHFFNMNDELQVKVNLSNLVQGRITLRLLSVDQRNQRMGTGEYYFNAVNSPLSEEMVMRLCEFGKFEDLVYTNPHICLKIDLRIVPKYYDNLPEHPIQIQTTPERIEQFSQHIKKLIINGNYGEVRRIGGELTNDELLESFLLALTSFEQYNRLHGHLQARNLIPKFLVRADLNLVEDIISKTEFTTPSEFCNKICIYDAMALSIAEDNFARTVSLWKFLEWRKGVWSKNFRFRNFIHSVFCKLSQLPDDIPLKRFLVLHKDEIAESRTINNLYTILMEYLSGNIGIPRMGNLLVGLIRQPSLLTPVMFAEGFFRRAHQIGKAQRANFIGCAWDEAVQEGLKGTYRWGGNRLWEVMTQVHPDRFSGPYLDTEDWRVAVASKFPTKKSLEDAWEREHLPIFRVRLVNLVNPLNLAPKVLWGIIADYAFTWVVV